MKKYEDLTFEEEEVQKKIIADILWKNPFLSGITELNKTQLCVLTDALIEKLDFYVNLNGDWNVDERDFKDILFDQKCLMIETLDPDFFKEG